MEAFDETQGPTNRPEKAHQTICMVQITRIGDVIQTLQAAQTVRNQHPNIRLILVARPQFAAGIKDLLLATFDRCVFVNIHDIVKSNDLQSSIEAQRKLLEEISDEQISVTVNLSFSKSSAYLCSLIESDHKLGMQYDFNASMAIRDKWSQYVYSNVMRGPLCPFSLVDIYRNILGVTETNDSIAPAQIKNVKRIVIHPFASHDKKHWKMAKWTEIIYKLLKENPTLSIDLVGNDNEKAASLEISRSPLLTTFSNRLTNYVGKTSLMKLNEIVKNSSLFLGHDSMVGHLASLNNIKTVTISLGTVRPHETTPYGANNYNIAPNTKCFPCFPDETCDLKKCHSDVPYQVVIAAMQQIIDHGEITQKLLSNSISSFHLDAVEIYKSTISSANMMELSPIISSTLDLKNTFRLFYRIAWLYTFNEIEEKQGFPKLSKMDSERLIHNVQGLQQLFELAEFGKKYSKYILEEISSSSPNLNNIKDHSHKIDEIDRLQQMISQTYPFLEPIIDYYSIAKTNLLGDNIVKLAENSYISYNTCATTVSVIYDLVEKTVAEYKSTLTNNGQHKSQLNI